MTKIAYWDCQAGIAGDMCLGALLSAGLPCAYLEKIIADLALPEVVQLQITEVKKAGQLATKVDVNCNDSHQHRHLSHIQQIIEQSNLPPRVKEWSIKTFTNLAIAEGKVHGLPQTEVHFHEVGAVDAIVDIVGTCAGLDYLGIEEIYCSAMPTGGGLIECAHGKMPVPVPAVLELFSMGRVPVFNNGINRELVTPTGAAIAVSLSKSFVIYPPMHLQKIGVGAGTIDLEIPNILRLWIGNTDTNKAVETIAILETQIDDTNPQAIAYTMELLLANGALDVFTQAVTMKKSRQGILLTVICPVENSATCQEIIFRETTTLGIRYREQTRLVLKRELKTVETIYGKGRVKIAYLSPTQKKIQPEYEDCAQLARSLQLPFSTIWSALQQAGAQEN
ncbi:MAG: nickel pincer cofactor biosynthesis protein LarC [Pseudanabaenaceae cyanobacterium]